MKKVKIFIIATELPVRIGGAPVRNFNLIKYMPKDLHGRIQRVCH